MNDSKNLKIIEFYAKFQKTIDKKYFSSFKNIIISNSEHPCSINLLPEQISFNERLKSFIVSNNGVAYLKFSAKIITIPNLLQKESLTDGSVIYELNLKEIVDLETFIDCVMQLNLKESKNDKEAKLLRISDKNKQEDWQDFSKSVYENNLMYHSAVKGCWVYSPLAASLLRYFEFSIKIIPSD